MESKDMRIVLIGPPCSGRSTQAEMLSKNYGLEKISADDLLREAAKSDERLGMYLQLTNKRGVLLNHLIVIPDEKVNAVVLPKVKEATRGFVLDGFPSSFGQAMELDKYADIAYVIKLKVMTDETFKRLTSRRYCSNSGCGAECNLALVTPKVPGRCDRCGSGLQRRISDSIELFSQRLDSYEGLENVLDVHYHGVLIEINAKKPMDIVYRNICNVMNK
ncbi:MAG: nucleoside monophosphate kinase [Candidatus Aenigmatarchaeota archaeon]